MWPFPVSADLSDHCSQDGNSHAPNQGARARPTLLQGLGAQARGQGVGLASRPGLLFYTPAPRTLQAGDSSREHDAGSRVGTLHRAGQDFCTLARGSARFPGHGADEQGGTLTGQAAAGGQLLAQACVGMQGPG